MKHQLAIFAQRLENMKIGIKQAENYLSGVSRILAESTPNIEMAKTEIDEIRDFLAWLQGQ